MLISDRALLWVTAILTIAVSASVLHLGMIQYPGEDGGYPALIGWQLLMGARPYIDVLPSGMPPLFLLGAKWAFALGGVRWFSIVAAMAALCAVTFAAEVAILRRIGFGTIPTLGLALAAQLCATLPISFWWYNQITSVVAVVYLSAVLLFITHPEDWRSAATLGFWAIVLSWSKANYAAILLVGSGVVFLISHKLRRRGLAVLIGAAVASILLLKGFDVGPRSLWASYLIGLSRADTPNAWSQYMHMNDPQESVLTLRLLAPALVVGLICLVVTLVQERARLSRVAPWLLACLLGVAAGYVAMGTNNEYNLVEVPLMLVGVFGLLWIASSERKARVLLAGAASVLAISVISLAVVGGSYAQQRTRVWSSGPGVFFEAPPLQTMRTPEFFRGLKTGPNLIGTMANISDVLRVNTWSDDLAAPVMFGPRLLAAYPAFGIRPPNAIPLWWQMYQDGKPRTTAAVKRFSRAKPHMLVLYNFDTVYFPPELMGVLQGWDAYQYKNLGILVPPKTTPYPKLPPGSKRLR